MNIIQFVRRIKKASKDPERKKSINIFSEYLRFKLFNPSVAEQYFHKRLYRKSVSKPGDYLLTHDLQKMIWYFNDMNYYSIFDDKILTEDFFNQFKLPIVKSFAYNKNTLFFKENQLRQVHNPVQLLKFLEELKNTVGSERDELIIKPIRAHAGRGISKESIEELQHNNLSLEKLFQKVISSDYLYQEVLEQHPELDKINPSSLNTIRVDTFVNRQGTPHILSMRLRCSAGTSFLDNISNGGLFIGIDSEEGTLHDEGFNDFSKFSGRAYTEHPYTGIRFGGFKIPFFEEVKKLSTDAAKLLPGAKVVAWDIAVQPQGPIIVEGNYFPGLLNSEIVQKGFRNSPVFLEILEELNSPDQEKLVRQKIKTLIFNRDKI